MSGGEEPLLLRVSDLPGKVRLSSRQIRKLRAQGLFPVPSFLGKTPVWSSAALREWVDSGCPPCHDSKGTSKTKRGPKP